VTKKKNASHRPENANGREAEHLGFGIHLPFLELTEEKLLSAIKNIIDVPTYRHNANTLGSALVDQVWVSCKQQWLIS
jgi:UDP:flavonoid glycosyltransferase YjiC (YdhE family)